MKNVGHNRYQIEIAQLIKRVSELNSIIERQVLEINMYKNCVTETQLKYQEILLKNLDIQDLLSNVTAENLKISQSKRIFENEMNEKIQDLQQQIIGLEKNNDALLLKYSELNKEKINIEIHIKKLSNSQNTVQLKNEELAKENSNLTLLLYHANKEIELLRELSGKTVCIEPIKETFENEHDTTESYKKIKNTPLKRIIRSRS